MNFGYLYNYLYICIVKSFKFRVYPTQKQEKVLLQTLFSCFKLYNTALQHRRDAYKSFANKSVSYKDQQNELPKLKDEFSEYTNIHSQVLQNVLHRVDLAFKSFFQRVKTKNSKVGFPRYKSFDRYDSFCFPQSGFRICNNNRVELSKIGIIKVTFHRQIPYGANVKTCTIKREGVKWYVIFVFGISSTITEKKVVTNAIGIDLGLKDFAVLSSGEEIKNPKYLKQSEKKLKEIQSKYSKGKSKKVKRQLSNLHHKITNQRKDFQHKLSRRLVDTFDLIAYEDLKIKQMIEDNKYNLQKHISDAAWGQFIFMLIYKAEDAGKYCVAVNPKGTTQKCSNCGCVVPKNLYERLHACSCGFSATRDHNAALNIHKSGIGLVDSHNLCLSSEAPLPLGKG